MLGNGRMPKNDPICNSREHMMYLLLSSSTPVQMFSSKEVGREIFMVIGLIEVTGGNILTETLISL